MMFELWCKNSYRLSERDNYLPEKNKRETIIQISEHFQALLVNSINGACSNRFEQAVYFICDTDIFGYTMKRSV
jgi:hypothetical protein